MLQHPVTIKGTLVITIALAIKVVLDYLGIDLPTAFIIELLNAVPAEHPFN